MKKLTSILSALALVAGMTVAESIPAYSAPTPRSPIDIRGNQIVPIQYRHWRGGGWRGGWRGGWGGWGGNRYWYRGHGGPYWGAGAYWGGGPYYGGPYYGGYYRPGYRYYDGGWFPLAAFGSGLIIGNALAAPAYRAPVYGGDSYHIRWCYNRYRSYRAYDDTFQPYYGPRRQCISPY